MTRTLLTLLCGLAVGVSAHLAWVAHRRPADVEDLPAQLAWMKANLGLNGEQLARIQALHERSAPQLVALAAQVVGMKQELAAFERERRATGRIDFLEFAKFVDQRRALDRACLDSTRKLVAASASVMTPVQREQYLSLVGPALKADETGAVP